MRAMTALSGACCQPSVSRLTMMPSKTCRQSVASHERARRSRSSTCWVIQAWRSMARAPWGSGDGGAAPLAAWGDAVRGTAAVASALVEVSHAGCVDPRVDGHVQVVDAACLALEAGDVAVGELLGAVHGVVSVSGTGGSLVLSKKLPISSP